MLVPVPLLLRVFYYFPDFPHLVAPEITLQMEDVVPEIPHVNQLLSNWQRNSGVVFNSIELSGPNLPGRNLVRHIGSSFQLN